MKSNPLVRRQRALLKTMNKFKERPFAWGENDCASLFRSHIVAMGHKKAPKIPKYDTALGAKRALKEMGFESMEELVDSLLPRIAPAQALPGDVVLMGGPEGEVLDAVVISVGGKVFGYHEDGEGGAVVITPNEIKAAWRG